MRLGAFATPAEGIRRGKQYGGVAGQGCGEGPAGRGGQPWGRRIDAATYAQNLDGRGSSADGSGMALVMMARLAGMATVPRN
jgi:hypothetical protein